MDVLRWLNCNVVHRAYRSAKALYNYAGVEKPEEPTRIHRGKLHLMLLYFVLSWEMPTVTWGIFLAVNVLYWLVVLLELKLLGVILFTAFIMFTYDRLVDLALEPGDEITDRYTNEIRQIRNVLCNSINGLIGLRKESPSTFCIGMCVTFLALSYVARCVSGHVLSYLILLGLFFIPLVMSQLPSETKKTVWHMIHIMGSEREVLAEEELLPFISGKDFNTKDPELESTLTDRTVESITNSLIGGITSMPSYLEAEDLPKDIEEEDLFPMPAVSRTPGDLSSDSDSEHQIHFDSTHFNGDTSSEDEKLFGKGLKFADKDLTDSQDRAQVASSNISEIASVAAAALRNRFFPESPSKVRKQSSSDSEFEIINSDDLDDHLD